MDLAKLREQIDIIDKQIVELYEQRMDVSKQVAQYKIETGKKVFDKEREEEKLRKVKSMTHNEFNSLGVEELLKVIPMGWQARTFLFGRRLFLLWTYMTRW